MRHQMKHKETHLPFIISPLLDLRVLSVCAYGSHAPSHGLSLPRSLLADIVGPLKRFQRYKAVFGIGTTKTLAFPTPAIIRWHNYSLSTRQTPFALTTYHTAFLLPFCIHTKQ